MTLKEQTIKRIENQKEKMEEDNQTFGRTSVFDRLELEYLENLLKALEVLDILKKQFKNSEKYKLNTDEGIYDYIMPIIYIEDEIKEWLENDKQRT